MNNKVNVTAAASANAGLCLIFPNQFKVWIDLFPSGETRLFSFLKESEWEQIKKDPVYYPPDLVLFTHTHPDHYCSKRAQELRQALPEVPIVLPGNYPEDGPSFLPSDPVLVNGREARFSSGPLSVCLIATQHSGKEYAATRHYSILLTYEGKTIFVSGDADWHSDSLSQLFDRLHPDLAVLTFPWASTQSGRELVQCLMKPEHVLLYHVPNPEEDRDSFRSMALNAAGQLKVPDCRVISRSLQVERYLL